MAEKFFFSYDPILAENPGSTLKADNLIRRLIYSRWVCLSVAALFFLSARCAIADPVGDFFKKVGRSISKAFQPQPTQRKTKKTRAPQRRASRESNAAEAGPSPTQEPSKSAQEGKLIPVGLPASAVPEKEATGDIRYGIPVPGQKGMVISPYSPDGNYIDVSAFAPGSAVKDPYTGKIFLVP
jgi:hypothetical protein